MARRYPRPDDPRLLCGVDEAGRGPLAGAVFAAAVVLAPDRPRMNGLHDSKLLDAGTREKLSAPLHTDFTTRCAGSDAESTRIDAPRR